jgi:hypothetical protein
VVNVLEVAAIRWHGIRVTDGWLSLTFDQQGINGGLGGAAYDGYVNGGLSVPFSSGPSSGWFSGSHLDLGTFSATAGGGHVAMVGTASFEATAATRGDRLDTVDGRLALTPGRIEFPDLDRVLKRLPANAPSWQRDLARIGVETFRDYPYDRGEGTLAFRDAQARALLSLEGTRGSRRLEANYHADAAPALAEPPAD